MIIIGGGGGVDNVFETDASDLAYFNIYHLIYFIGWMSEMNESNDQSLFAFKRFCEASLVLTAD